MGSLSFFGQVLCTTLPTVSELAHHKQRWPQRFYSGGEQAGHLMEIVCGLLMFVCIKPRMREESALVCVCV